ncbi:hypothetical protein VKT23_019934 [Stygiomarasmius scandens]|uniref:Uncharacterized protein n=1 Tax=Marasmiellus scandens TaxID=2682957 RepID=A0ABR1IP63_9AGAR
MQAPIHDGGKETDDDDEAHDYPAPLKNFLYLPILRFQILAAPRTPRYNLPDNNTALRWTRMVLNESPQSCAIAVSAGPTNTVVIDKQGMYWMAGKRKNSCRGVRARDSE